MKKILRNWKTSLSGLASVILGIISIAGGDVGTGIATIVSGVGLVAAKDSDVTGTAQ
ncbi:MAG: hypothetical protein NW207_04825 [Cytophagales bacterium]|nr:hypothetical protein [Cytophagales bacterium]